MASASLSYAALILSKPSLLHHHFASLSLPSPFKSNIAVRIPLLRRRVTSHGAASAVKAEYDLTSFARDLEGGDAPPTGTIPGVGFDLEDKEETECPQGLRKYETMVVLRPDMSEDERLAFTSKYEELLVAGGGMSVEVYNRGVIPLSYGIKKKNRAGETNTYLDGIYLLFTYCTKPESMSILGETLLGDDDVIRSSSFKIRKRKLF